MRNEIDRAIIRSRQHWFDDGLAEIITGVIFVLVGVFSMLEERSPEGSTVRMIAGLGVVLIAAGGLWVGAWALKFLKARLVYPRTGYVKYRRPDQSKRRRWTSAIVGAILSASLGAAMSAFKPAAFSLPPVIQGVAIGFAMFYVAHITGLLRFYALAALSVAAGLATGLKTSGSMAGIAYYFGVMGATFLVLGLAGFAAYMRSSQAGEVK